MIIIGEKINSSIPASKALIEGRQTQALIDLAKAQQDAGASFVDINAGMFLEKEGELLAYLAATLKDVLDVPLSIDTPSVEAASKALAVLGRGGHLINSLTAEPKRLDGMSALAAEYGCSVVALCMQANGGTENLDSRLKTADFLVNALAQKGIAAENVYIDPMLHPLGADENGGVDALETIRRLRALFPDCHISVGLSNLSFGLPNRRLINRAFAVAAMTAGLDAAIADPLDSGLMGMIAATDAILGNDEFCIEYIGKCRRGELG
jgi:cobalamin-dependent methionine synthase I